MFRQNQTIMKRFLGNRLTKISFICFNLLLLSQISFAQISGTWSQSGSGGEWQAQAGSVYRGLLNNTKVTITGAETMICSVAYSNGAGFNNPSLRLRTLSGTKDNFTFGFLQYKNHSFVHR